MLEFADLSGLALILQDGPSAKRKASTGTDLAWFVLLCTPGRRVVDGCFR